MGGDLNRRRLARERRRAAWVSFRAWRQVAGFLLRFLPGPSVRRLVGIRDRADILPMEPRQLPDVKEVMGQPRREKVAGSEYSIRTFVAVQPIGRR